MSSPTDRILTLFAELNAIPRCSTKERAVSDWLVNWASDRGLEAERDDVLNVLIRVPGRGGLEEAAPVAIQGHMDMVCEKTPDSGHNFESDPIRHEQDGEWLHARETTLGADNGIAVALALALAERDDLRHPPLELLFTVDEESGLTGAQKLKEGWLRSRALLNIDSEDEGVFTIGCAGGLNSLLSLPVEWEAVPAGSEPLALTVSGLQGGHSGVDIHLDRANANVLAARIVADLRERFSVRVGAMEGGNAHNAIPRDCRVTLAVGPGESAAAQERVRQWKTTLAAEYGSTDPNLDVTLSGASDTRVLTDESANSLVGLLLVLPHGVVRMSREVDGLVETSSNLATVRSRESSVEIDTSQRSSSTSQLDAIAGVMGAAASLAGASVRVTSRYPAWEPNPASTILATATEVFRETFSKEPVVEVIHAGLECGVIGSKHPGMEMLSIGPTIQMPHSPDERLNVPSLGRLWTFLVQLLASLR